MHGDRAPDQGRYVVNTRIPDAGGQGLYSHFSPAHDGTSEVHKGTFEAPALPLLTWAFPGLWLQVHAATLP